MISQWSTTLGTSVVEEALLHLELSQGCTAQQLLELQSASCKLEAACALPCACAASFSVILNICMKS